MKGIVVSLVLSLALTLAIELPAGALLGARSKKQLALVALVNVLTNPPVVLTLGLVTLFTGAAPRYLILLLELAALAAEALLYRGQLKRPFLTSLILNGLSYLGGLLLS